MDAFSTVSKRSEFIICGDCNMANKNILVDVKHWKRKQKISGFFPEERGGLVRGAIHVVVEPVGTVHRLIPFTKRAVILW